jgi:hypothetical protein
MANSKPRCLIPLFDHPIEQPHPLDTFYPSFIHLFGKIYALQELCNLYLDSISLAGIRVSCTLAVLLSRTVIGLPRFSNGRVKSGY